MDNLPSQYQYFDIPARLNTKLNEVYNFSQFHAIKECLKKEGVTLIQGPPGTGKTTTILGVLSVLLNSRSKTEKYKENRTSGQSFHSVTTFTEQEKLACYRRNMPWIYQQDFVDW